MEELKITKYKDGIAGKLKNKRVALIRKEGAISLQFLRLKNEDDDENTITALTTVNKKTVHTELLISNRSAVALYQLLGKELKISDAWKMIDKNLITNHWCGTVKAENLLYRGEKFLDTWFDKAEDLEMIDFEIQTFSIKKGDNMAIQFIEKYLQERYA